ncbi:MAG: SDR family oxidoreductase [Pseudomonadota bacterium]
MARLMNKKAVVTGGTTGIGFASAKAMIAEGARVIITGQDAARVKGAANTLGEHAHGFVAPAQDPIAAEKLADEVATKFGKIDILFANAGVSWPGALADVTKENAEAQMAINFIGPLLTLQKMVPHLNNPASVIFTTSCLDQLGSAGMGVYSASKAALRSIARTYSAELKDQGVRINTIAPGPIETPIYGKLGMSEAEIGEMASEILKNVPLGRFGSADEIAEAVVFLASDGSRYMLGEEITLDGGWSNL